MRGHCTIGYYLAFLDMFPFEHCDMAPLGNQCLVTLTILASNEQSLLALGILAKTDRTCDLRKYCRVLGFTCFEQVGDPWQTPCDVTRLGRFLWNTSYHVTHIDYRIVFEADNRARRQEINCGNVGIGKTQFLAFFVDDLHHRPQILGTETACLGICYHHTG